jgi:epoxyqueuosine reductase
MDLHDSLIEGAKQAGFPLAGALDLDSALASGGALAGHVERYDRWLDNGYAGEMNYLERGRDRRADPRRVFPSAKSILCVAIPYSRGVAGAQSLNEGPRYARYLRGRDYHLAISEKLEAVMQGLNRDLLAVGQKGLNWKVCVDTSAVLERSWAALAGLGWIGKNTLLIHPKLGSYLFLAEVLIDTKVNRGPVPIPNLCGHCDRCLKSCPTGAFVEPGQLDSKKCISYWTLEKRGALPLNESERANSSGWIAGCDICQEVCPFNIKPAREVESVAAASDVTTTNGWLELLRESAEGYRERVKDSALNRVKPEQFSRNLALALCHAVSNDAIQKGAFLDEIRELVAQRSRVEQDPNAKSEWEKCALALHSPKRKP